MTKNVVVCDEEGRYRYIIVGGTLNYDQNIYLVRDGVRTGEVIGKTLTQHSFFDENGNVVEGAILDLLDLSGIDFINDEIIEGDPHLLSYMPNAVGGAHYDFKRRDVPEGIEKSSIQGKQHIYRGMPFKTEGGNIIYASARDVGNYAAGYIAGKSGMNWKTAIAGFDALQTAQPPLNGWQTEGPWSRQAQRAGYNAGASAYPLHKANQKIKRFMNRP
ncbi:MAG: hypothetical protein LUF04_01240 [Bacteroides sp.]|nr:hypothetical protein [Bacteroides sp.]